MNGEVENEKEDEKKNPYNLLLSVVPLFSSLSFVLGRFYTPQPTGVNIRPSAESRRRDNLKFLARDIGRIQRNDDQGEEP